MTMKITITSEYEDEKGNFTQTGYFCFVATITALSDLKFMHLTDESGNVVVPEKAAYQRV